MSFKRFWRQFRPFQCCEDCFSCKLSALSSRSSCTSFVVLSLFEEEIGHPAQLGCAGQEGCPGGVAGSHVWFSPCSISEAFLTASRPRESLPVAGNLAHAQCPCDCVQASSWLCFKLQTAPANAIAGGWDLPLGLENLKQTYWVVTGGFQGSPGRCRKLTSKEERNERVQARRQEKNSSDATCSRKATRACCQPVPRSWESFQGLGGRKDNFLTYVQSPCTSTALLNPHLNQQQLFYCSPQALDKAFSAWFTHLPFCWDGRNNSDIGCCRPDLTDLPIAQGLKHRTIPKPNSWSEFVFWSPTRDLKWPMKTMMTLRGKEVLKGLSGYTFLADLVPCVWRGVHVAVGAQGTVVHFCANKAVLWKGRKLWFPPK